MNILFLSVSTGGGHIKAAETLKDYIMKKYANSRCLIIDTFKYISPVIDKLIVDGYINMINKIPFLYGRLYRLSESSKAIVNLTYGFSSLLSYRLMPLINVFEPSIIVCTHTIPLQMVSHLKKEKLISVPIVAIVTDYVSHPFWKLENVDALIVPHEEVKDEMVRFGIPENIIFPYGIPLSEGFVQKHDRQEILNIFGLEDKLTGLIMGGSLGIRSIRNSFEMLINTKREMQIIVVTGKNTALKNRIENLLKQTKLSKTVRVFGYTNLVPYLMDISDFIITKPGGMTISEALAKELIIFLVSPIPGQEERNSHFLVRNNAALEIKEHEDIDYLLTRILDDVSKKKELQRIARNFSRPYACHDTAVLLRRLANFQ